MAEWSRALVPSLLFAQTAFFFGDVDRTNLAQANTCSNSKPTRKSSDGAIADSTQMIDRVCQPVSLRKHEDMGFPNGSSVVGLFLLFVIAFSSSWMKLYGPTKMHFLQIR
ncbi:hypothetical protein ASPWEDRAFT_44330 [Aspergillus wentii DTO 134E9]|uniref:Uncharacterized protein n=1 Tax=Aspergillus wentii DTO 134E9 TaxID=1073089 RepID=A0A1L9RBE0_ASPWE|nr:uncharacterized protein ASPWEDRAFT_44330 [Aspergillus wentii DTO 134E9]OJJ32242.1 hypothetical protein ASPWEDRAFT_44330 [Aspergillus wentii DTO 134E9]